MHNIFINLEKIGFSIPKLQENVQYFANTSCKILDGKFLSKKFVNQAKDLISKNNNIIPKLAVILLGENPASQVYVNNKLKIFAEAGFASQSFIYKNNELNESELLSLIDKLNCDDTIHGILVQLPLPAHFTQNIILNSIAPQKDVDGFLAQNIGALACSDFSHAIACTPFGIMTLLHAYGIELAAKHVVVIGRSNIVGKPIALLTLAADATVSIAHSKTKNLAQLCKSADILIAAAGQPKFITKDYIKPGAIIIDVGIHKIDGKLCGDVHPSTLEIAAAMTPVPGGVGPMTIAMLMVNTAISAWIK